MCQTTLTYNIGGHLHEIGTRLVGRGPRRRWMLFTHIGIEIHHLLGKCAIEREDGKDKGWARGRRDGGNGRSESNCEEGLVVILLTSRCYVGNSRSVSLPGSDVKLRVLAHQAAHATVHAKTMGPAHPPGLHRRHCSNVPGCVKHWLHWTTARAALALSNWRNMGAHKLEAPAVYFGHSPKPERIWEHGML